MYGSAAANGDPVANVPVTVRVLKGGYRRLISVETDESGAFQTTFFPLPTEAGLYEIAADRPSVGEDVVQDSFFLLGMRCDPATQTFDVVVDTPLSGEVNLLNLTSVPLSGITAPIEKLPPGLDVDVQIDPIDDLAGSGQVTVRYTILAGDTASPGGRVFVNLTSAEGATAVLQLNIRVRSLLPELATWPGTLSSGMVRGKTTMVTFELYSIGGAPTGDLDVLLPVAPWLSLASPATIGTLAPGEHTTVTLVLSPAEDLPLGPYEGSLVIEGMTTNLAVSFRFDAVSEAAGGLHVLAVDEFTYFAVGEPKVAGASVTLRDPYTGDLNVQGVTDGNGELVFADLPEAYYDLTVSADGHGSYRSVILISANKTLDIIAFLPRQLVTYRWTVIPIETEDRYIFSVETVFETNVPVPVITVEPAFIDMRDLTAEVNQVNFTITNHGCPRAGTS